MPKLLESIGDYMEKHIQVTKIPELIAGFTSYRTYGIGSFDIKYVRAIVQPNGSSFTYSSNIQREVKKITKRLNDDVDKSKAIFDWIISNIKYEKRKTSCYKGALQTYIDKNGVCGESAALQVTMERLAGNIAFLTEIEKGAIGTTSTGRIVNITELHACTAHVKPNGEILLIDTTIPEGFGIKYDLFKIVSDEHSFASY